MRKAHLRILIYGINYAPELTGIGKYSGDLGSWLAERGHEVHVVTALPYYPSWRIHEDYRNSLYRTERSPSGVLVRRVPLYVPEKPNGLKRVAHLFSFLVGSLPAALGEIFWRPHVVFTVEPTFFAAPLALLVAKTCDAKSWLHVQDFEVDAAFDLGLLPAGGAIHDFALWLEESFISGFDRVSSISAKMVEKSIAKGVKPERSVLFPNWVDVHSVRPLSQESSENSFRRELGRTVPGIESKVVLLCSGNMGAKHGLELLAPLAAKFAGDDRAHFICSGDGAFRPQLERMVAGMRNVTLLPVQPLERLNDLLNAADIHLLTQRSGAADLVMPSRLTGMLSSGRPVIATADQGTQVAMVVEGRGLVVPAENATALHHAVSMLIDNRELRVRLGHAAREYALSHLGRDQVLERFERDLEALVRTGTRSDSGRDSLSLSGTA